MIRSASLDTRVRVFQPVAGRTASGAINNTFTDLGEFWCSVIYLKGREAVEAQQTFAEAECKITLRWLEETKGIDAKHELQIGAQVFEVTGVLPVPGGRPERLEIFARRRND